MKANLRVIAADIAAGLGKVKAVADAIAGSPVTHEMERLVPGLARLVGDAEAVGRIAAALGGVLPELPAIVGAIEGLRALGLKPMDAGDPAYLARERELGA